MEAALHQSPVSLLPSPLHVVGVQRQQLEVVVAPAMAAAGGREQCPRCASRDTKFCYYNNYNTAQPRHFCRACRRYWTLGGSLRNVPIGGSTRKRARPARPTRAAVAAAIAAAATASSSQVQAGQQQAAGAAPPVSQHEAASGGGGGGLVVSLLGAAPLLEGLLGGIGFDLGLGQPAGEVQALGEQLGFGAGAMAMAPAPLLWPARILEGDTWKSAAAAGVYSPFPAAAALWQELAAAAPVELAGGLLHHGGGAPQLM